MDKPKSGFIELVAHVPLVYALAFFFGGLLQIRYPVQIGEGSSISLVGFALLVIGPVLILWAQVSVRKFRREMSAGSSAYNTFGPYRFTRNPTYLGLTFLILGFGFISNSAMIVFATLAAFVFVNYTILKKEEKILEERFGASYLEYKKKVRRWI